MAETSITDTVDYQPHLHELGTCPSEHNSSIVAAADPSISINANNAKFAADVHPSSSDMCLVSKSDPQGPTLEQILEARPAVKFKWSQCDTFTMQPICVLEHSRWF